MNKNYLNLVMVVIAVGAMTFFSSCLKNDDDYTPQPRSGLFILHAAPGINAVDVFLNDSKITKEVALGYTDGGSLSVSPAPYDFTFKSAADNNNTIASYEADSLQDGNSYSVILYDTGAVRKVMFIKNTFETSQSTGAFIRFLQLSPDAGKVTINMDDSQFQTDREFADNLGDNSKAEFTAISGAQYNFTATNEQGDTLDQVKKQLKAGNFYTLYLDGLDSTKTAVDSLQWKLRLKAM